MKQNYRKMYPIVFLKYMRGSRFITRFLALFIVLTISLSSFAQEKVAVTGNVSDESGEPLIGAVIKLKTDPNIGTATDLDGEFVINIPSGNQTLVISYVGMESQEIAVRGNKKINVTLKESSIMLNETVIVGYGQQKKESVVGAITQTSGKVLERAGGVSSLGAALTGNLPGVVTTSSTGMPGEEDPRIVIRGISSWNNSAPLILVDGIERAMSSVDINSVETISVLKDASATAVFGVKGANGVILITTKRGQEGKATIRAGVNTTVKVPSQLPKKYDSYDALRIRNMAIENELGLAPNAWVDYTPQAIIDKYRNPANLEESERYPNVDWEDVLFKDYAMSYNANLNISGGTRFVKYFAAVDFLSEGDLFEDWNNGRGYNTGYGYNRINARSNLDFQLTKSTVLKVNLAASHGAKKSPWDASGSEYPIWQGAYNVAPDVFLPVYSDGTWGYYPGNEVAATNSAMNLALGGAMEKTTSRINTDFTIEQDLGMLVKGLKLNGTVSWDNTFVETRRGINDLYNDAQQKWIDPDTGETEYKKELDGTNKFDFMEGIRWTTQGGEMENWSTQRNLFYQLQLNYATTLFDDHSVTAMGLFSRNETAIGSMIPNYREDWVFRVTYDFRRKYFLEYNGAYNGSEKFSKENRFAFFSSGALGWMVSEESFMKNLKFLDMLKLRASYGEIGDDNIGARWLYMDQWAYGNTGLMSEDGSRSPYVWYRQSAIGNPNVHWETVRKTNFGADFSFLNGLIAGNVDFFRDKRSDVLINGSSRSIPSFYGGNPPVANLGRVSTKGYELELRFNYVFSNGLRLWSNFNMTHAKDKVLDADDPEMLPDYKKQKGKQIGQTYTYVGHGYYNTWDEIYGATQHSTNNNQKLPGNYNVIDFNGDGIIDNYDEVPYGYPNQPQNTYNATIGFEWKGFSAFVQFYGVTNVTRQVVFESLSGRQNTVYDEGTYWSKNNVNADSPIPRWISSPTTGYNNAHRYMYDGSYIRLKNAEMSYTWNSGWVKKIGLSSLRLYINGNNLWSWSRMPDDRESNFAGTGWASQGAYPTVKRFNLGLNITL